MNSKRNSVFIGDIYLSINGNKVRNNYEFKDIEKVTK